MSDLDLFKKAISEALNNKFDDTVVYHEEAFEIIKNVAIEYADEFSKATVAEADEEHVVFVGDKHYFDFNTANNTVEITDIIYW